MSGVARSWTLSKAFEGMPKQDDFNMVEETISFSLKPGEILLEALFWTVDPYMRGYPHEIGKTLTGGQVAKVKVSRNPEYPEGSLVLTYKGWRTLTLVEDPDASSLMGRDVTKLPDFGDMPASLALGCLGMPGMTAYFGLLDRGQPKSGDVVLVSAAAGAVGSVVGQLAKIMGCTVIGSAGTKEKCDWVKELGFDHVFNYKEISVDEALKKFAPGGIDIHFDNVGGDFAYTVMDKHLKPVVGRVVSCGAISQYNSLDWKEKSIYRPIIYKQLEVRGIYVAFFKDRFAEATVKMLQWVKEGKIKYRETITNGFENMPAAFISLFHGANTGKAIIKA